MATMTETTGAAGEQLAVLLSSTEFQRRAAAGGDLRDLATAICREADIAVVVIYIEDTGQGSHRIVWQPMEGGPFLDQWFSLPPRS